MMKILFSNYVFNEVHIESNVKDVGLLAIIRKAFQEISQHYTFFADILSHVYIYEDFNIKTFQTDGQTISYNPTWAQKIIKQESLLHPRKEWDEGGEQTYTQEGGINAIIFILLHEILHISRAHHGHIQTLTVDPDIFNYAADIEINLHLDGLRFHTPGSNTRTMKLRIPEVVIGGGKQKGKWDKYKGKNVVEIYNDLLKHPEDLPPKPDPKCPFDRGGGKYKNRKVEIPTTPPPKFVFIKENKNLSYKSFKAYLFESGLGGNIIGSHDCPYSDPEYCKLPEVQEIFDKVLTGELTAIPCPNGGWCPIPPDPPESSEEPDDSKPKRSSPPVPRKGSPPPSGGSGGSKNSVSPFLPGKNGERNRNWNMGKVVPRGSAGKKAEAHKASGGKSVEDIAKDKLLRGNYGNLPAFLEIEKNKLLNPPKLDWKRILRQFLTEAFKSDYERWTADRRGRSDFIKKDEPDAGMMKSLIIAFDTSGSMCSVGTIQDVVSEISHIVSSNNLFVERLYLIYCDTEIAKPVQVFKIDELSKLQFNPGKFATKIKPQGGGGTSFVAPFVWSANNIKGLQALIYFTDGYGEYPKFIPKFKTLWTIVGDETRAIKIPFGKKIDLPTGITPTKS